MAAKQYSYLEIQEKLRAAIGRPLPGREAQFRLAPAGRTPPDPGSFDLSKVKQAAVLALFYEAEKEAHIILTQRVEYKGVHSGQISFPGGKREPQDKDFLDTALRETYEEVGIAPEAVEVAGAFSELYIPPSNFLVYPYLGFLSSRPAFERQVDEVHRIISLNFNHFLDDSALQKTEVEARGFKLAVPAFVIEGHIVWGATAMMLAELKAMVLNS